MKGLGRRLSRSIVMVNLLSSVDKPENPSISIASHKLPLEN
jgi:hypothetical protein